MESSSVLSIQIAVKDYLSQFTLFVDRGIPILYKTGETNMCYIGEDDIYYVLKDGHSGPC